MWERIRNLREDRDLTQKEMGRRIFVVQKTYSDYERGRINFSADTLKRIAQILNTSTDYLLELTDDPTPPPKLRRK